MKCLVALSDSRKNLQEYQKSIGGYFCSDKLLVIIVNDISKDEIKYLGKYFRKTTKIVVITDKQEIYANCNKNTVEKIVEEVNKCLEKALR
jgi:ribosomal protein L7Ae-like RNA K-turn-binding protein